MTDIERAFSRGKAFINVAARKPARLVLQDECGNDYLIL